MLVARKWSKSYIDDTEVIWAEKKCAECVFQCKRKHFLRPGFVGYTTTVCQLILSLK